MTERLICASDALVDGGNGVRFEVPDMHKVGAGGTAPAFVIRYKGRVYGYLNRCGHIPVELDWQHGEFFDYSGVYLICGTHGALYAPETGRCMGGRCNRKGLQALAVVEREGSVYLIEEGTTSG